MNANPPPNMASTAQPDLTPRQRQILKLLQEGKVNKEVARELDIGVGTVKQHIVALFKKLNVRNRAMAVSRGRELLKETESQGQRLTAEGLLERRPCVVLSVALPEDADPFTVRLMHGALAALAALHDAVFLARKGHAGDVIFGIQRVTEYDLAIALQVARTVYEDVAVQDAALAGKMRACLSAGLAVASMKRFGGWTGEAIASAAIASARESLSAVPPGHVALDEAVRDLAQVLGIGGKKKIAALLPFYELDSLGWTGTRRAHPLVGRADELATLDAALDEAAKGRGGLIYMEGEMGMGKSRLCEELAAHCTARGGELSYFCCLPPVLGHAFLDAVQDTHCALDEVVYWLDRAPSRLPELVVVDDFHLLEREQQGALSSAAAHAAAVGKLVVLAGRRGMAGSKACLSEVINLRRLPPEAIESLVRETLGSEAAKLPANDIRDISGAAAGVPLFAVELARHHDVERLALPLLVVTNARLDSLNLDRALLRAVARNSVALSMEKMAATLGGDEEHLRQQVERTVAAGVLSWGENGCLSFTHPLLQRVIACLVME
jgi:DNA-binding CsgD family transcriptional regulator